MLDHVADRELDPQQSPNAAEELALAITVLTCGSAAACEAVRQSGLDPSRLCALLEFHRNGISACGGQYLDVCMERQMSATTDEALQMTARKAGSLGRLAGDFGARVATHDSEVISLFGEFGFNLFTYLQLIDDMRDACPRNSPQSDLAQHKKSVPLVFFYNSLVNGHPEATSGMMLPPLVAEADPDIREVFEASGAQVFCAVVAETFLNRAKGHLEELESRLDNIDSLKRLVTPLEITPQDLLAVP